MEELAQFVKKCDPKYARKRPRNPQNWKREQERQERYKPKSLPKFPSCNHNQKSFRCMLVTCQDIRKFHKKFYKCKTKLDQDNFLIRYCHVNKAIKNTANSKRKLTIKYNVPVSGRYLKPVCQKTFLDSLQIKKDRVQGVMNRVYLSDGSPLKENRGGDRKSAQFEAKRLSVEWFLEKFKGIESHYCRSQTNRIYLPSGLNIRKMWRMYNQERDEELKVKQSFFRKIVNTSYNFGFGSPRTDVCSTRISLQERLKTEKDPSKRNELIVEKRIHRLKYKAFYNILQEENEAIKTISFDCQKNQPLPKLPDQSAYFSRQFNFYHFAIVQGNSRAKLTKENVRSYYWTELDHAKGSNQIISAIYHFLQGTVIEPQIKILRIVCDGCSGQNKNTGMVSMLGKWLYNEAPRTVKKIEIIFPVVEHSFIPPDRVFAKIERTLKTKEVIVSPSEYIEVLEENETCIDLTTIPIYDWKDAYEPIIKPTTSWHFPFMRSKRFFLTRTKTENILVQGEETYRNEVNQKRTVTKKNKKITMITPLIVRPDILPKAAKVKDVTNLLQKHFGQEWRSLPQLQFYVNIENQAPIQDMEMNDDLCEHGFEDVTAHI
ncbi:hypothetical protein ABMA27_003498 [Loxostege sticticalis]|uniref:DUF7869 domain-containing protein n=1 Tax=Loxostege sticticalis TaxID=481309 RepID=A0ABR3HTA1_LOXSC